MDNLNLNLYNNVRPPNYKNKNALNSKLIDMLQDDIKWPDTYIIKKGDVSFAKEAIEALSYFANNAKESIKSKKKHASDAT